MCAGTGAAGLTVTLATAMATTADDGAFTIARPTGSNLVWHVTGSTLVTSVVPYGATTVIPAMRALAYSDIADNNGVSVQNPGEGEIFVRVVRAGAAVAHAQASSAPPPQYGALYETADAVVWNLNAASGTGSHGAAWIAGAPGGLATVTITPSGGAAVVVPNVPVEDQANTYLAVEIP